jgi:hypothetical protein
MAFQILTTVKKGRRMSQEQMDVEAHAVHGVGLRYK